MRKIILLFLFFLITIISKGAVFAQESMPVIAKQIDYSLPYPGILPDNRLYFTKVIRDKLISFLISDPLKKAEFNLLVADKRLSAGFYLAEKGNFKLAESTISKGENYFSEAINEARDAKNRGTGIAVIATKLSNASEKHKEILKGLQAKSPRELKQSFYELQKRVESFEKEVALSFP